MKHYGKGILLEAYILLRQGALVFYFNCEVIVCLESNFSRE